MSNSITCTDLTSEIARRRTFAIISHPDAGKTTLTEKFLLYAGQIEVAGAVRGRKTTRAVTSDWMQLERERGISITSTALSFNYRGHLVNLLDTPGHRDFSEDTYRTLAAADSAVMVIDAANGVEGQTRKLFRVCAARKIPILTFVNKMDRLGKSPLDLLAEIENDLKIEPIPMNWPLGLGDEFQGIYDRHGDRAMLFQPTEGGSLLVPTRAVTRDALANEVGSRIAERCMEELDLLDGASGLLDPDRFRTGEQTPVYFGSAATNYGIESFLDSFLRLAPAPGPRSATEGMVPADRTGFAGIVFKIQANLNPKHRDRVAFVRVCAGVFTPETEPIVARTGESLRVKGSHRLFAREREDIDSAFPGDVIGIAFTRGVRLGDTLCELPAVCFDALPQFTPECFATIRTPDSSRRKQLLEGLTQLADEGAIQLFTDPDNSREFMLAAVGELQFDVVRFRLEAEYGVKSTIEPLPYRSGSWVGAGAASLENVRLHNGMRAALDYRGVAVLLADDPFTLRYFQRTQPELKLKPFGEDMFAPKA